jgi:hypothetical protein
MRVQLTLLAVTADPHFTNRRPAVVVEKGLIAKFPATPVVKDSGLTALNIEKTGNALIAWAISARYNRCSPVKADGTGRIICLQIEMATRI